MARKTINNVKLGIFVMAGVIFLILMLYMVGKNRSFLGSNYTLKAHFTNIDGLAEGNNVRYSGIQVGTVKNINILHDTIIEVGMTIREDMKKFIHVDDFAHIGGEGLMGNKVVNISPSNKGSKLAENGDLLLSKHSVSLNSVMEMLDGTNNDIAGITKGLKLTIQKINTSTTLWELLNDKTITGNIKALLENVVISSKKVENSTAVLDEMIQSIQHGKGNVGMLLKDTMLTSNLKQASFEINRTIQNANQISTDLQTLVKKLDADIHHGKGIVPAVLNDSLVTVDLRKSMENIERGTYKFDQSMEALKHNFFFRGYFKKQEKLKIKAAKDALLKK